MKRQIIKIRMNNAFNYLLVFALTFICADLYAGAKRRPDYKNMTDLERVMHSCSEGRMSKMIGKGVKTPEQCSASNREYLEKKGVVDPRQTPTSDFCANTSGLPLDHGECEKGYDELKQAYEKFLDAQDSACSLHPERVKQCEICTSGSNQQACDQSVADLSGKTKEAYQNRKTAKEELRNKIQAIIDGGFSKSQEYADHFKKQEDFAKTNPEMANKPNSDSSQIGASTPRDVPSKHNGDNYSNMMQAIERIKSSDISQSQNDWNTYEQVRSPIVSEHLARSIMGKEMMNGLNTSIREDSDTVEQADAINRQKSNDSTNYGRVQEQQSGLANNQNGKGADLSKLAQAGSGLAGAAGGKGTPGSSPNSYESGLNYASDNSSTNGTAYNEDGTPVSATSEIKTAELGNLDPEQAALLKNSTAASSSESLRDIMRSKLAEKLGMGGDASGASRSLASDGEGGGPLDANNPLNASTFSALPNEQISKSLTELGTGNGIDSLGIESLRPLNLAGSDTDTLIKGFVSDFENDLDLNNESHGNIQAASGIQGENSESLFIRTHDVHRRSLVRGLVSAGGTGG
ncbi:MAG: hypothetical protein M9962_03180 [Oligoflexia bacterium]|nr:hypothetical protein [Oligoflexia bacterium]